MCPCPTLAHTLAWSLRVINGLWHPSGCKCPIFKLGDDSPGLFAKEALGEGGDETNLDEEAKDGLDGC